jgi:hypothetical protein
MTKQQVESPGGFASWGGVSLGLAAVLAVAAVGTQISAGEPTSDGTVALAAAMADNSQQAVVSSWLFMLSAVMFVGFAAFIRARWQLASAWVPLAAALFVAAAAVDFTENLVQIGMYDVVVPAVANQGAAAGADLVVLGDALGVIAEHGQQLFHVVLGLAIPAFAAALLDKLGAPRWMGYLAAGPAVTAARPTAPANANTGPLLVVDAAQRRGVILVCAPGPGSVPASRCRCARQPLAPHPRRGCHRRPWPRPPARSPRTARPARARRRRRRQRWIRCGWCVACLRRAEPHRRPSR